MNRRVAGRYSASAKLMHWFVAAAVIVLLAPARDDEARPRGLARRVLDNFQSLRAVRSHVVRPSAPAFGVPEPEACDTARRAARRSRGAIRGSIPSGRHAASSVDKDNYGDPSAFPFQLSYRLGSDSADRVTIVIHAGSNATTRSRARARSIPGLLRRDSPSKDGRRFDALWLLAMTDVLIERALTTASIARLAFAVRTGDNHNVAIGVAEPDLPVPRRRVEVGLLDDLRP